MSTPKAHLKTLTKASAKEWCVYAHLTADSGQIFYVGQAKKTFRLGRATFPRVTASTHRNKWWVSVVSKHGFVAKVLKHFTTKNEADAEERRLIKTLGKREDGGVLVNLADGGEGNDGAPRTEEWRRRISEANKGKQISAEHREKLRLAHVGKKLSEEHKKRISAASRNHKNFKLFDPDVRARAQEARKQVKTAPRTRDHQDKINAANKGQKRSAEARLKMSLAAKKRHERDLTLAA